MKNLTLIKTILTGLCVLIYAFLSFKGETTPAWVTLIWVIAVFFSDLDEYSKMK